MSINGRWQKHINTRQGIEISWTCRTSTGRVVYRARNKTCRGTSQYFETLPEAEAYRDECIKKIKQQTREGMDLLRKMSEEKEPYHIKGCKKLAGEISVMYIQEVKSQDRDTCLDLLNKNRQMAFYIEALGSDLDTVIYETWKYWMPVLIKVNKEKNRVLRKEIKEAWIKNKIKRMKKPRPYYQERKMKNES